MHRVQDPPKPPAGEIRRFTALLAALCTLGCSGWCPIPNPAPAVLAEAQQVRLWSAGGSVTLRRVTIAADSIVGTPVGRTPRCDSCRVALARSAIDSIWIANPRAGNEFNNGAALGFLVGVFATFEFFKSALGGT